MSKHKAAIYCLLYFAVNLLFLTSFPFVHSDEVWLSGLSLNMLETSKLNVTEPFFNLYPRHPHAIKTLFHLTQMAFISLFSYNIFTVRLISLIFGVLTLFAFNKALLATKINNNLSFCVTIILSLNVQFIYAAHFARQEIIILFVLVCVYYYLQRFFQTQTFKYVIISAVVTGASIGVHPNSFIVAPMAAFLFLANVITTKAFKLKPILTYVSIVLTFAVFFVLLSLQFDKDFFQNYAVYGAQFEVLAPLTSKFAQLGDFIKKLYYGVSGTYYTPNIKLLIVSSGVLILFATFSTILNIKRNCDKKVLFAQPLFAIYGVLCGIILIGRYNQTSIVFVVPFVFMVFARVIKQTKSFAKGVCAVVLLVTITNSALNIAPYLTAENATSYQRYLNEIGQYVPKDAKTLCNLNAGFAFENGALIDYRNLTFIKESGKTFAQYIQQNEIEYIVISEEIQLIYNIRPKWNGIYGNVNYLAEMDEFLLNDCELLHTFTDDNYGVRIVEYRNVGMDFKVKIFKVK